MPPVAVTPAMQPNGQTVRDGFYPFFGWISYKFASIITVLSFLMGNLHKEQAT